MSAGPSRFALPAVRERPTTPAAVSDSDVDSDARRDVHGEETPRSYRVVRDTTYYLNLVVFQVEGCLFRLPRHHFEQSEVFQGMFALPSGTRNVQEGESDETPIHLNGIKLRDFRAFLKVLMPLRETGFRNWLNTDEWLSVLELAHMWNFRLTKMEAVDILERRMDDMDVVQKILFIRKYDIQSWALAAYEALATREDSLTLEEMTVLGLEFSSKMVKVREMILKRASLPGHPHNCRCVNCFRFSGNSLPPTSTAIHEVFGNPVVIG